jgi:hypothetical protein
MPHFPVFYPSLQSRVRGTSFELHSALLLEVSFSMSFRTMLPEIGPKNHASTLVAEESRVIHGRSRSLYAARQPERKKGGAFPEGPASKAGASSRGDGDILAETGPHSDRRPSRGAGRDSTELSRLPMRSVVRTNAAFAAPKNSEIRSTLKDFEEFKAMRELYENQVNELSIPAWHDASGSNRSMQSSDSLSVLTPTPPRDASPMTHRFHSMRDSFQSDKTRTSSSSSPRPLLGNSPLVPPLADSWRQGSGGGDPSPRHHSVLEEQEHVALHPVASREVSPANICAAAEESGGRLLQASSPQLSLLGDDTSSSMQSSHSIHLQVETIRTRCNSIISEILDREDPEGAEAGSQVENASDSGASNSSDSDSDSELEISMPKSQDEVGADGGEEPPFEEVIHRQRLKMDLFPEHARIAVSDLSDWIEGIRQTYRKDLEDILEEEHVFTEREERDSKQILTWEAAVTQYSGEVNAMKSIITSLMKRVDELHQETGVLKKDLRNSREREKLHMKARHAQEHRRQSVAIVESQHDALRQALNEAQMAVKIKEEELKTQKIAAETEIKRLKRDITISAKLDKKKAERQNTTSAPVGRSRLNAAQGNRSGTGLGVATVGSDEQRGRRRPSVLWRLIKVVDHSKLTSLQSIRRKSVVSELLLPEPGEEDEFIPGIEVVNLDESIADKVSSGQGENEFEELEELQDDGSDEYLNKVLGKELSKLFGSNYSSEAGSFKMLMNLYQDSLTEFQEKMSRLTNEQQLATLLVLLSTKNEEVAELEKRIEVEKNALLVKLNDQRKAFEEKTTEQKDMEEELADSHAYLMKRIKQVREQIEEKKKMELSEAHTEIERSLREEFEQKKRQLVAEQGELYEATVQAKMRELTRSMQVQSTNVFEKKVMEARLEKENEISALKLQLQTLEDEAQALRARADVQEREEMELEMSLKEAQMEESKLAKLAAQSTAATASDSTTKRKGRATLAATKITRRASSRDKKKSASDLPGLSGGSEEEAESPEVIAAKLEEAKSNRIAMEKQLKERKKQRLVEAALIEKKLASKKEEMQLQETQLEKEVREEMKKKLSEESDGLSDVLGKSAEVMDHVQSVKKRFGRNGHVKVEELETLANTTANMVGVIRKLREDLLLSHQKLEVTDVQKSDLEKRMREELRKKDEEIARISKSKAVSEARLRNQASKMEQEMKAELDSTIISYESELIKVRKARQDILDEAVAIIKERNKMDRAFRREQVMRDVSLRRTKGEDVLSIIQGMDEEHAILVMEAVSDPSAPTYQDMVSWAPSHTAFLDKLTRSSSNHSLSINDANSRRRSDASNSSHSNSEYRLPSNTVEILSASQSSRRPSVTLTSDSQGAMPTNQRKRSPSLGDAGGHSSRGNVAPEVKVGQRRRAGSILVARATAVDSTTSSDNEWSPSVNIDPSRQLDSLGIKSLLANALEGDKTALDRFLILPENQQPLVVQSLMKPRISFKEILKTALEKQDES